MNDSATITVSDRGAFRVKELAEYVGISTQTIARMAKAGTMPRGVKIGRIRIWPKVQIDKWLADGCQCKRNKANV
jgi:excisionase family DNA binding protein